jgi:hypothetical protein
MVAIQSQAQPESESHVSLFTPQELRQQSLPPSERDFQVFESVVIDGATTRQVAAEFGVSQSRIVQIRRHVAEWMGAEVPPTPRLTPVQRLRLAAEIAERRADHLYSKAMEGWRASQQPQTSVCRSRLGEEMRTARERHGDPRYLLAAMRITERQMHLSGTIRKVVMDAEAVREGEAPAEALVRGSGIGVQEEEQQEIHPPVRDCSHNEATAGTGHLADAAAVGARDCQDDGCDELENRRRLFLAALHDDATPVHPPIADAGGMFVAALEEPEAASIDGQAWASVRPLNRHERRARQRMLKRKLRRAK